MDRTHRRVDELSLVLDGCRRLPLRPGLLTKRMLDRLSLVIQQLTEREDFVSLDRQVSKSLHLMSIPVI